MRRTLGGLLFASALSTQAVARSIVISQQHGTSPHDLIPESHCLSTSYFGTYGQQLTHVFVSEPECIDTLKPSLQGSGPIRASEASRDEEDKVLCWLEEAVLDDSIRRVGAKTAAEEILEFIRRANPSSEFDSYVTGQTPLSDDITDMASVLYSTRTGALVSLSPSLLSHLDMLLPAHIQPTLLPTSPLPLHVTKPSTKFLRSILANLKFNPDIAALTSTLSLSHMRHNIEWLTGEDSDSPIVSRHSFSDGARTAANWIQKKIEKTGAECQQKSFLEGFAPNVICRFEGTDNTTGLVILSAHYDSRGSFGSVRAPGGDDDGSGVTHVLAIAQAIADNKLSFKSNVELVTFAGEEQGLLGSRAYAAELREQNANITLMIQADMLAYHDPAEPPQLGLPQYIGLPEAGQLVANVSALYAPELTVGLSAACCSDHQSFHEQGFPATQVFERAGPIIDPMYHNSGDLSNRSGYDLGQVRSIAKATFATLLEVAGYSLPFDE
ncbi:hypothetical protein FRC12_019527 [Ceratobasidium sp. 428]|nr:hypothetical protein FRC12_019527 [Ceratobasidium sp. 428]